eukprot:SAG31_NODE_1042_length_10187_cov_54.452121_1_plen_153_part_00
MTPSDRVHVPQIHTAAVPHPPPAAPSRARALTALPPPSRPAPGLGTLGLAPWPCSHTAQGGSRGQQQQPGSAQAGAGGARRAVSSLSRRPHHAHATTPLHRAAKLLTAAHSLARALCVVCNVTFPRTRSRLATSSAPARARRRDGGCRPFFR